MLQRIVSTSAPPSLVLIRLVVGGVFLSEGVQEFLYPGELAAGRFSKIGLPAPDLLGPFVGTVELVCGALILLGSLRGLLLFRSLSTCL